MARLLSRDEAREKCHIGERERCCAFLVVGMEGLECAYVDPQWRRMVEARRNAGHMTARSGPCADPMDATSEAEPYAHRCLRPCFAMTASEHVDRYGVMPRLEDLARPG